MMKPFNPEHYISIESEYFPGVSNQIVQPTIPLGTSLILQYLNKKYATQITLPFWCYNQINQTGGVSHPDYLQPMFIPMGIHTFVDPDSNHPQSLNQIISAHRDEKEYREAFMLRNYQDKDRSAHLIFMAYIKCFGEEFILYSDSLNANKFSLTPETLYEKTKIPVFYTEMGRQADGYSCIVDAIVLGRELTQKVNNRYQLMLTPDHFQSMENRHSNAPVQRAVLPPELLITTQRSEFIPNDARKKHLNTRKMLTKPETLDQFLTRHRKQITPHSDRTRPDYLHEKGRRYARIIQIQYYLNEMEQELQRSLSVEERTAFITEAQHELKQQHEIQDIPLEALSLYHMTQSYLITHFNHHAREETARPDPLHFLMNENELMPEQVGNSDRLGTEELHVRNQLLEHIRASEYVQEKHHTTPKKLEFHRSEIKKLLSSEDGIRALCSLLNNPSIEYSAPFLLFVVFATKNIDVLDALMNNYSLITSLKNQGVLYYTVIRLQCNELFLKRYPNEFNEKEIEALTMQATVSGLIPRTFPPTEAVYVRPNDFIHQMHYRDGNNLALIKKNLLIEGTEALNALSLQCILQNTLFTENKEHFELITQHAAFTPEVLDQLIAHKKSSMTTLVHLKEFPGMTSAHYEKIEHRLAEMNHLRMKKYQTLMREIPLSHETKENKENPKFACF